MKSIDIFHQVLEKYKTVEPVSLEVQEYILSSRKEVLKKILKKMGQFGIFYSISISIYYLLKKFSLNASLLQSKIIAGALIAVTATVTTGGGYVTTRYIIKKIKEKNKTEVPVDVNTGNTIEKKLLDSEKKIVRKKRKSFAHILKYPFRVKVLSFRGEDKRLALMVSRLITQEIQKQKTRKIYIIRKGQERKNLNRFLMGSVRKLGSKYIITAKVVDAFNSKTISIYSKEFDSSQELGKVCSQLAGKIVKGIQ